MHFVYFWLAVIVVSLVIELVDTGTLISVWFAVGAVIPFVMSFWGIDYAWYIALQFIVFGVVSAVCLLFLRKIAKKLLFKGKDEKTGLDTHVGKSFKISSVVDDNAYIKINGIDYKVVAQDDNDFEKGQVVKVVKFSGNKVVVEKD